VATQKPINMLPVDSQRDAASASPSEVCGLTTNLWMGNQARKERPGTDWQVATNIFKLFDENIYFLKCGGIIGRVENIPPTVIERRSGRLDG